MGLLLADVEDTRSRPRVLRTSKTAGNVGTTHADLSTLYSGTTTLLGYATFTGATGPNTINIRPGGQTNTQTTIPADTFTGARNPGWRDPETEYPIGPARYSGSQWSIGLRVTKSAQNPVVDVVVQFTVIAVEIPQEGTPTRELGRWTPPPVTMTNAFQTINYQQGMSTAQMRRNSKIHLEVYVQHIDPNTNLVSAPAAGFDIDLYSTVESDFRNVSQITNQPVWFYPVQPVGGVELTGDGTLAGTGRPSFPGSVALSGEGSLSATGSPGPTGTVQLSGGGQLSGTGIQGLTGSLALSGSGSLSGVQTRATAAGTAALTGEGSLAGTARPQIPGTVTLTGSGTLAGAGIRGVLGTLELAGSGALTGSPAFVTVDQADVQFTGSGVLSAGFRPEFVEPLLLLSGDGELTGAGVAQEHGLGTVELTGSGTLTPAGAPRVSGSIALTGSGALVTAGRMGGVRSIALTGSGALTFTRAVGVAGVVTLTGSGTLTGTHRPGFPQTVALTGSGALVLVGRLGGVRTLALTGSGTLTMVLTGVRFIRTVNLTGSGVLLSRSALYYVRARSPNTGQMVRAFVKVRFAYNLPWIRCRIKVRHPQEPSVWIELDNEPPKLYLSGSGQLVGTRALIEPIPLG